VYGPDAYTGKSFMKINLTRILRMTREQNGIIVFPGPQDAP
jgi:hypothetical protein